MTKKWFYLHNGQTLGPLTAAQLKDLAMQGKIVPEGKVWAEGGDAAKAVPAATAIDFRRVAKPKATAAIPVAKLPTAIPVALPVARPAAKKLKRSSSASKAAAKLKHSSSGSKAGRKLRQSKAGESLKKKSSRSKASVPLAQVATPPISLEELFRKTRFALEQWVDEEDSVDLVLAGNMDDIKTQPAVQAIIKNIAPWGQGLVDRLFQHLAFTVENRRKYYLALVARGQAND